MIDEYMVTDEAGVAGKKKEDKAASPLILCSKDLWDLSLNSVSFPNGRGWVVEED